MAEKHTHICIQVQDHLHKLLFHVPHKHTDNNYNESDITDKRAATALHLTPTHTFCQDLLEASELMIAHLRSTKIVLIQSTTNDTQTAMRHKLDNLHIFIGRGKKKKKREKTSGCVVFHTTGVQIAGGVNSC